MCFIISESCGFSYNLSSYPVLINTPNYPFLYENKLSCVWTFSANDGERIDFRFINLNEQSSSDNITVMFLFIKIPKFTLHLKFN